MSGNLTFTALLICNDLLRLILAVEFYRILGVLLHPYIAGVLNWLLGMVNEVSITSPVTRIDTRSSNILHLIICTG